MSHHEKVHEIRRGESRTSRDNKQHRVCMWKSFRLNITDCRLSTAAKPINHIFAVTRNTTDQVDIGTPESWSRLRYRLDNLFWGRTWELEPLERYDHCPETAMQTCPPILDIKRRSRKLRRSLHVPVLRTAAPVF